ncbi:MAG TPA: hypothetical protein VMV49_01680 [Candidatus Deferrimicrobium sp.]|nr:hypothetical protein [Candidatus Deferrimicrobium sp.]
MAPVVSWNIYDPKQAERDRRRLEEEMRRHKMGIKSRPGGGGGSGFG